MVSNLQRNNNKYNTEHTLHGPHCDTALIYFYQCLGNWNGGAHKLGGLFQTVCEEYNWLNNEAWHIGRNVLHVKPKFHMFQEMAQYRCLELGNPKGFWEYKDEDFVGWASKLAKRWGGPRAHTSQADSVILRYRALASGRCVCLCKTCCY